jgi:hypothetical protein
MQTSADSNNHYSSAKTALKAIVEMQVLAGSKTCSILARPALKVIAEVQASAYGNKTINASSFDKKSSSTFQLVVASVD